jgi:hypothetical protein
MADAEIQPGLARGRSAALPEPQALRFLLRAASDACLADVVEMVPLELMRREVKFSRAAFSAAHELCHRHSEQQSRASKAPLPIDELTAG